MKDSTSDEEGDTEENRDNDDSEESTHV